MAGGFLSDTETAVTSNFTAVATAFGSGLVNTFRPAFVIGFTIWITFIAYEVAFGKSEDPFTYIFTKIAKIFLIGTIALYGWPDLAELLNGLKDGFVGATTISSVLETNLMNPVTDIWAKVFDWFSSTLKDVGWTEFGRLLSVLALFVLLFIAYGLMTAIVALFAVIALAMYLVANTVFILLMAIGPFFLLCLAFPFMQRFFETFIGNVMTSVLALGFTVLMVMFVANLFGLNNIAAQINPALTDPATLSTEIRSLSVLLATKAAMALLIVYLYYKIFDLASALGGGLNMGNNLVGGVRAIMRDVQRSANSSSNVGGAGSPNQISHGSGGGGSGGGGSHRSNRGNSTLTGMAFSLAGRGISATASGASAAARGAGAAAGTALVGAGNFGRIAAYGAGRAAGEVGRFAYNRYASTKNRISAT